MNILKILYLLGFLYFLTIGILFGLEILVPTRFSAATYTILVSAWIYISYSNLSKNITQ